MAWPLVLNKSLKPLSARSPVWWMLPLPLTRHLTADALRPAAPAALSSVPRPGGWRCWLAALLGALLFCLYGTWVIYRGDGAQAIRARAQTDANALLAAQNMGWATLNIDDKVARLSGKAPDLAAKAALAAAAPAMFAPMIGAPGVFASLVDETTVDIATPAVSVDTTAAAAAPSASAATAPVPTAGAQAPTDPAKAAAIQDCGKDFAALLAERKLEFATGSARLTVANAQLLDRLADVAKRCQRFRIAIEGHTDARGSEESNQLLSQQRAEAVRQALLTRGLPAAQLSAKGFGEARPLDPNDNDVAWAHNRRIEFVVSE